MNPVFDWAYALDILPVLVDALGVTILATLLGMVAAIFLGLAFALARRSDLRVISWTVALIVEFVRSTPLLVQLYFLFYLLPSLGIQLSPLAAGVIALGIHYAAYCSEVYRSGIEGIPAGQWDAAKALNLSRVRIWYRIVLPQAIPPIVPAMGNYLVAMFKDTPLLSAVTVVEILQQGKILGSETFRYVEPLTLVGLLFLVLSLAAAALIRVLESRLRLPESRW